jgi:hypothetical protein
MRNTSDYSMNFSPLFILLYGEQEHVGLLCFYGLLLTMQQQHYIGYFEVVFFRFKFKYMQNDEILRPTTRKTIP